MILDISRGRKFLCILLLACGLSACFGSKTELIPLSEAADPMGKAAFLRYQDGSSEAVIARVPDRAEYFFYNEGNKPDHTRIRFARIWSMGSLWTPQYVMSAGSPSKSGRLLLLLSLDRSHVGTMYTPKQKRMIATLASAKAELQEAVRSGQADAKPLGKITVISKAEADAWLRRYRGHEAQARNSPVRNGAEQTSAQQRPMPAATPAVLFDSEIVKIIPRTEFEKEWCFSGGWANVNLALKTDIHFSFSPFNTDYLNAVKNFVVPAVRTHCRQNIDRINLHNYLLTHDATTGQSRWQQVNWLEIVVKNGAYVGYRLDGSGPYVTTSYERQKLDIKKLQQEADEIQRGLTGRY